MKIKIYHLLYLVLFLLAFLSGYFIKGLSIRQKSNQTASNKFSLFEINDERLLNNDKFDYYKIDDKSDLPSDLRDYLINELPKNFIFNSWCDKNIDWSEKDFDFSSRAVDLNDDGEKEFILMPWKVCGSDLIRGASGNGSILVVRKNIKEWGIVGDFQGNGYLITKNKTNGFYDILSHSHGSAFEGVETLYKWTYKSKTGFENQYEPIFSKWYRFDRSN